MAESTPCIRIGHLQIVDHLILGMSSLQLNQDKNLLENIIPEPVPLNSWEQICDNLENGKIDGAFMTVPLAMDLFSSGMDIRLLMLAHRSGSLIVKNKNAGLEGLSELANKSMLVPSSLSVQAMLLHQFLTAIGLNFGRADDPESQVVCEDVVPALMPEMLALDQDGDIGGFTVSEPFGRMAIDAGNASLICPTDSLWKNHPCCGFVLRQSVIDQYPDGVARLLAHFMDMAARLEGEEEGVKISCAQAFLNQPRERIQHCLEESRVSFSPPSLIPDPEELDAIQTYINENMGLIPQKIPLTQFLDTSWAEQAISEQSIENRD